MLRRLGSVLFIVGWLVVAVIAQDDDAIDVPSLAGMTAPQAQAALNEAGLLLHPVIETTDTGAEEDFRVVDQSPQAGTSLSPADEVRVTIQNANPANITLVWDIPMRAGLEDFETLLFSIRNLEAESLGAYGLQFATDERADALALDFPGNFRATQCWQIWASNSPGFFRPPECDVIQHEVELELDDENLSDAFWLVENSTFVVREYGVYRGVCATSESSCDVWLSPQPIPHDMTAYVYMVYDNQQFVIYNNHPEQWMDLTQLQLATATLPFSDLRNWDSTTLPTVDRLAPNQCVQFTVNSGASPLEDCTVIAMQTTRENDIFWREAFSFVDQLGGETEWTCPAANGRTLCLAQR
ncbi:MAG: PASTA domain-containing protein [Chloroflexota bacterium]